MALGLRCETPSPRWKLFVEDVGNTISTINYSLSHPTLWATYISVEVYLTMKPFSSFGIPWKQ